MHVITLQNIPCVDPVLKQKPEEDLMIHLTFGFPNPFEGQVNTFVAN